MPPHALADLLATLEPLLHDETVVFCLAPAGDDWRDLPIIGRFREAEGTTLILDERQAVAAGLSPRFRAAWITLTVQSDLAAVGLTAAVARALADAGISCNMMAAIHHDHLFVPAEQGRDALAVLQKLQGAAREKK